MSLGLKSFNESPSLQEQAIAHWEENLKRVKAMNWRRWNRTSGATRRAVVFSTVGNKYPHIGGKVCPYCTYYDWSCRTRAGAERCPLKQESVPGGCCTAWLDVREALIIPWNKVQTITAIKAMIKYIEERG